MLPCRLIAAPSSLSPAASDSPLHFFLAHSTPWPRKHRASRSQRLSGRDRLLTEQSPEDWPTSFRVARFIPRLNTSRPIAPVRWPSSRCRRSSGRSMSSSLDQDEHQQQQRDLDQQGAVADMHHREAAEGGSCQEDAADDPEDARCIQCLPASVCVSPETPVKERRR